MLSVDDRLAAIRTRLDAAQPESGDDGAAVARAGKPAGWLSVSARVVAEQGFNINRRGAVFVPAVQGRDIAALACRLGEASRSVYLTLLEY